MYRAILDCAACGNRGEIELTLDHAPVVSEAYEYLGKSVAGGYFHLLCESCKAVLLVDPVAIVGALKTEKVKGIICEQGALLYRMNFQVLRGADKNDLNGTAAAFKLLTRTEPGPFLFSICFR